MQKGCLALLLLLAAWGPTALPNVHAQSAETPAVEEIREAYRRLEYGSAESMARSAMQNYPQYTLSELTDIHTFLALIAYNRGERLEARRQFLSALQLSPEMELDPVLVPPKIQTYFEELKAEREPAEAGEAPVRYVLLRDPRPDAALRSMVVPGWGQLYKGQRTKGIVFSGLFAAAAGGALVAHVRMRDAFSAYDGARTPSEAEELYEPYNRWYRVRNGFVQGGALIWLASYVDALLTRGPPATRELSLRAQPGRVSLRLHF